MSSIPRIYTVYLFLNLKEHTKRLFCACVAKEGERPAQANAKISVGTFLCAECENENFISLVKMNIVPYIYLVNTICNRITRESN